MNDCKLNDLLEMSDKLCGDDGQTDKNLFEMANFKEYRHSSILGYLLNRKEQGQKVHLKTFLARIFGARMPSLDGEVEIWCEKWVDCPNGKRPIDILVTAGKKFALIIENKCRGASDQDAQICDYWYGVKNERGFDEKDIYVVYLPPLNAFSTPSANSLGELQKRFAANGDLSGHLMTYSYRDLILPWLTEDVLPNITYGAGVLADSLRCYIDLLETMFAVRSESRDVRASTRKKFSEYVKKDNSADLWDSATDYLRCIDEVLSSSAQARLPEKDANRIGALQSKLWEVRSVLREDNPLLDPANLSYEVYWLLRKNPTPFASQYVRSSLDSGLFFKTGRRQSTYDGILFKEHHWLECCFNVNEFVNYCKDGEAGAILEFGVGDVDELCFSQVEGWGKRYLKDKRWSILSVNNCEFKDATASTRGDMLWKLAETISRMSKSFSDIVKAEL